MCTLRENKCIFHIANSVLLLLLLVVIFILMRMWKINWRRKKRFGSRVTHTQHYILLNCTLYVCKYAEHRCVFYSIHLIKTSEKKRRSKHELIPFGVSPLLTPMWRIFRERIFLLCCANSFCNASLAGLNINRKNG